MTNQHGYVGFESLQIRLVGSLSCFHNHSCKPNTRMSQLATVSGNSKRASVFVAYAASPMRKNEEIFVSYDKFAGQNRSLGQQTLRRWL